MALDGPQAGALSHGRAEARPTRRGREVTGYGRVVAGHQVAIEKLIVPKAHPDDALVSQASGHRLQLARQLHLADSFPQEIGHAASDHIG